MDEELREGTPRPWHVHEQRIYGPNPGGTTFRTVADLRYKNGDADAALIAAAVNGYDRLRRIEAAARALSRVATWSALGRPDEVAALRTALGED